MFPPLAFMGQILGAGFACGINLYAVVAFVGLGSRLGWVPELPIGLKGLESAVVVATALALYLIEAFADKVRVLDSVWDAIHTFVRPPAAALLAAAAFSGAPVHLQIGAAALAGSAAFAAHCTKAGLRITLVATHRGPHGVIASVAEDLLALAVVFAVLRFPASALGLAITLLLLLALVGPKLWRAFLLGIRALAARIRRFFRSANWFDAADLPPAMRALLATPPPGHPPPRAARAAVHGVRGVGDYRNGWLVLTHDGPVFLHRRLLGSRRVHLPDAAARRFREGPLADAVDFLGEHGRFTLFILKDGPRADLVAGHFGVPAA